MNQSWTITTVRAWQIEQQNGGKRLFLRPNYPPSAIHEPRSQFVVLYDDGTVGFDFPEDVPEYIKQVCRTRAQQHARARTAAT